MPEYNIESIEFFFCYTFEDYHLQTPVTCSFTIMFLRVSVITSPISHRGHEIYKCIWLI